MLKYIPYLLMFMVMGAVLYTWGLKKSQNQGVQMAQRLYAKCEKLVCGELKKKEYLLKKDIENLVSTVQVGEFGSRNKLGVTNPKEFATAFIDYMIKKGSLQEEMVNGKRMYCLKKQDTNKDIANT